MKYFHLRARGPKYRQPRPETDAQKDEGVLSGYNEVSDWNKNQLMEYYSGRVGQDKHPQTGENRADV